MNGSAAARAVMDRCLVGCPQNRTIAAERSLDESLCQPVGSESAKKVHAADARRACATSISSVHRPITSPSVAADGRDARRVRRLLADAKRQLANAQVNMWRARMGDSRWLESRERDHNVTWRPAKWLWMYS